MEHKRQTYLLKPHFLECRCYLTFLAESYLIDFDDRTPLKVDVSSVGRKCMSLIKRRFEHILVMWKIVSVMWRLSQTHNTAISAPLTTWLLVENKPIMDDHNKTNNMIMSQEKNTCVHTKGLNNWNKHRVRTKEYLLCSFWDDEALGKCERKFINAVVEFPSALSLK